jgi:phage FluMu protein Com
MQRSIVRLRRYPNVTMRCYHCSHILDYVGEVELYCEIITRLKCVRCPTTVEVSHELPPNPDFLMNASDTEEKPASSDDDDTDMTIRTA